MGRYLDERDLESPWSPLPLGDQMEDDRSFHRDRELRVAIDSCSIENNPSEPLSGIVEKLGEINIGDASRSAEWIRVSKVEHGHSPPRFTFGNVAEASTPVVAITYEGQHAQMLQQSNFVECELEYTADAGWMKVAVWSR